MIVADMTGGNGAVSVGSGAGPALGSKKASKAAAKVDKKAVKAGYVRQAKRRREGERA